MTLLIFHFSFVSYSTCIHDLYIISHPFQISCTHVITYKCTCFCFHLHFAYSTCTHFNIHLPPTCILHELITTCKHHIIPIQKELFLIIALGMRDTSLRATPSAKLYAPFSLQFHLHFTCTGTIRLHTQLHTIPPALFHPFTTCTCTAHVFIYHSISHAPNLNFTHFQSNPQKSKQYPFSRFEPRG